jgi:hypothetical protein
MRSVSDRRLPEPYRTWIDRARPLPSDVKLVPRTVAVVRDLLTFLILGSLMGGMGALFVLLPRWPLDPARAGWTPYLFVGTIALALWSVPLLLLRRLVRTLGARADLGRGTLRQGVFVGPEGVLVRMEPGRAHAIPRARFLAARLFPPEASRDPRARMVVVETLDGRIELFANRLEGTPAQIHRAAREVWPSWKEPSALMRRDRRKEADVVTRRRLTRDALLFGAAMLALLAAIVLRIRAGDAGTADVFSLAVTLGLGLVFASVVNVLYRYFTMRFAYRCAQCGVRAVRVDEALPAIHFYCRACNVEWDTGMAENADP